MLRSAESVSGAWSIALRTHSLPVRFVTEPESTSSAGCPFGSSGLFVLLFEGCVDVVSVTVACSLLRCCDSGSSSVKTGKHWCICSSCDGDLGLASLHSSGICECRVSCFGKCCLQAEHVQGNFGYLHSPCFLVCGAKGLLCSLVFSSRLTFPYWSHVIAAVV